MQLLKLSVYDKFLYNEYKEFIRKFKTIFIFGSGRSAHVIAKFLIDVLQGKEVYFIDNDEAKHNKEIFGIKCYGISKILECDLKSSIMLIASAKYNFEISANIHQYFLDNLGKDYLKNMMLYIDNVFIERLFSYVDNSFLEHILADNQERMSEKILQAFDCLFDDESCNIFYNRLLRTRFKSYYWMGDVYNHPQYFPDEIKYRLSENEVFIDCGAGKGESIHEFKVQTNNRFRSIYSFELDKETYDNLINNPEFKDDRIVIINEGVGKSAKEVTYRKDGCPSYQIGVKSASSVGIAKLNSLDKNVENKIIKEKPTFIKMDIEGAEMDALQGAKDTLRSEAPKLAICVYHKYDDLWEIPLYIHNVAPNYKLILRHHTVLQGDTVLYAYQ